MTLSGQRLLITGGNGFVGTNAALYFSNLGCEVTVAISPHSQYRGKISSLVKVAHADLTVPSSARRILKKQDIVLHFAAVDGNLEFKRSHSAEIFSQNMRINLNMFEAASRVKLNSFIFVSSSDIYLQSPEEGITEESPIDINLASHIDGYKLAKWTSELAAKEFMNQFKMPITIVRPGNLYGPFDAFGNTKTRFIPSVISKVYNDEEVVLWGDGTQTRSFLYIDDFLLILRMLLENKVESDVFNIASSNHVSLREVIDLVGDLLHKTPHLVIDEQKPAGAHSRIFNCAKLKSVIGDMKETPLREGLSRTIDYYAKNLQ